MGRSEKQSFVKEQRIESTCDQVLFLFAFILRRFFSEKLQSSYFDNCLVDEVVEPKGEEECEGRRHQQSINDLNLNLAEGRGLDVYQI